MKALLWKEWREHRLIFFLSLAVVLITRMSLSLRTIDPFINLATHGLLSLLFTLFLGTAPFANEFSKDTLSFLLCQPITRARIYWMKFLFGLLLLSVLIIFASLLIPVSTVHNYLSETDYVIYFRCFPFVILAIYCTAFLMSLLVKNALTSVVVTPFVFIMASLFVILSSFSLVPLELTVFFEGYPGLIVGFTLSVFLILVSLLCWLKAMLLPKGSQKILAMAASIVTSIIFVTAVGFFVMFTWQSDSYGPRRQYFFQIVITLSIGSSLFFIPLGFAYWKQVIYGSRQRGKVIGFALVLAVLAFLFIHTLADFVAGARLKSEMVSVRKAGLPLTQAEIIPPPVPEGQNAAPIFEQIFPIYEKLKKKYQEEWKYMPLETKMDFEDLSLDQRERLSMLIFNDPDFSNMCEMLKKASVMPYCQFGMSFEDAAMILPVHIGKILVAMKMAAVKVLVLTEQGRYGEALELARVGLHVGTMLEKGQSLHLQTIRIRCDYITMEGLKEPIRKVPPDSIHTEAFRRIITEIESKNGAAGLRKGFEGEAAHLVDRVSRGIPVGPDGILMEDSGFRRRFWGLIVSYYMRPLVKNDVAFCLNRMILETALCQSPYYEKKDVIIELDDEMIKNMWKHPVAMIFLPSLQGFHARQAESTAKLNGLKIVLALKIYKAENGEYPDSLDLLVPVYVKELPKDPFSGRDYIYCREGEGFVIYSVGFNQKDDGGIYDRKRSGFPDDLAWRSSR
jgi:hypothetical protein